MDGEELDFDMDSVLGLINEFKYQPHIVMEMSDGNYLMKDKEGKCYVTNTKGQLIDIKKGAFIGGETTYGIDFNNGLYWKEEHGKKKINFTLLDKHKGYLDQNCTLSNNEIKKEIESKQKTYEGNLKQPRNLICNNKVAKLTLETNLKKLKEDQQKIKEQLKTENNIVEKLELEKKFKDIQSNIKTNIKKIDKNGRKITKNEKSLESNVEVLQSLKEAEIKAEYLIAKENFEVALLNVKGYLNNNLSPTDDKKEYLKTKQSEFDKAKKALDTIDKEKELIKMNSELALLQEEKSMLNSKDPDQQTRITELDEKEFILSREIEIKEKEIVLGKAITPDEEQDAKKELEKAEKKLEQAKVIQKLGKLTPEISEKETQLQTKESDKKESEKKAFITQEEEDIKKARNEKEEVKQMRGELEGLKKEREKNFNNWHILNKEIELLDNPDNKDLKEELSKLKLKSKILNSDGEEKTRAEEIEKAIEEKKQKIAAVAADPFKFITTPANIIKKVAEAELELLKAQRDELIVTDDEEKKKEAQNNIENKRRELAEKRKNFSKKNITAAIETYALTQPTYSLSTDKYLLDSNATNATPITKKIEVDGQEKELKYLEFENNYYLADESGNLFNEEGKPIEYTGANDTYHYAIAGIPNSPEIRLVNNADSNKYLQISPDLIDDTYTLVDENSTPYIADTGETIENIKAKLIKEQVNVDEIGVYEDENVVLNSIKQYCEKNINEIDAQIINFENGIKKIENTQREKEQGNDVYFNDKELEEQKREAEAKKGACEAQKHFWEVIKNIDTSANVSVKDVYKRIKEFEDISNKITELSQNFDYGDPALNDKNIADIKSLVDLVEEKAGLKRIEEKKSEISKEKTKIQTEINDKTAELTKKEQEFKDKEKTALATNKPEDIKAAEKAKEEAKEIRRELEIFKGQNKVFKKQKDVLEKESKVLRGKNTPEKLTDAKLGLIISQKELEVLKATDESVKAKAEKELKEIREIQAKARGTLNLPPATAEQELENAEIELAKAQINELIATDADKQQVQDIVKDKKKNLAAARKNINKQEIPQLEELGNLPKPVYSTCANSNNLTVLANNTTPLEKTITVNGQEKKLNYLKYNDNYYLVDEDNNIVNEKGEQINYGGDYHYAIGNNGNLHLVNNDSNKKDYISIRNNNIYKGGTSNELYNSNTNQAKEVYDNIMNSLIEKQVNVDEIGVYEKQDDVLNSIKTYYKDGFDELGDGTKGKILELNDKLNIIKIGIGTTKDENEKKKLGQQRKEVEAKLKVCEAQKKFLEEVKENFDPNEKDQEKIKESYKHLKEFEDISNKITELSQNFDYGNPDLNDKNIAAIEGLVGLVERKAELEEKQRAINKSRKDLGNAKLDNEVKEDLKNSLDEQQKTLDEAYKDITSEQAEIIGEIEKFNNIDENDTDELSKATEAIKNSIKSIEEKSEVEKKIKDLEAKSKNYERSMEWFSVSDKSKLDKYIKDHFDGDPKKFVDDYNNEDNKKFYKENKFTKEHGGIDAVVKTIGGEEDFAAAVGLTKAGYTIKEKRWYRSKENKVLIAAQETYDKNVDKINRLKKENENLLEDVDPFLKPKNRNASAMLTAIRNDGIHLSKTREQAEKLLAVMRKDCINSYIEEQLKTNGNSLEIGDITEEDKKEFFENLDPKERSAIFQNYCQNKDNMSKYKNDKYDDAAVKLVVDTYNKIAKESFKKLDLNDRAIEATELKNLNIIKDTKEIVAKKIAKKKYKDKKNESITEGSDFSGMTDSADKAELLKNLRDDYKKKKRDMKSKDVKISEIKNNISTFRRFMKEKTAEEVKNELTNIFNSKKITDNFSKITTKVEARKQQQQNSKASGLPGH